MSIRPFPPRARWSSYGLVLVLLYLTACSSGSKPAPAVRPAASAAVSPAARPVTATAAASSAPLRDLTGPGPFAVGYTSRSVSFTLENAPRTTDYRVWYPAASQSGTAASARGSASTPLTAVTDTVADSTGLHPLIIYSHGAGGDPKYDTYLPTRLASQGFVVAAPLHRDCETQPGCTPSGDATTVFGLLQFSRPADVKAVIDDVLQKSSAGDPILAHTVDPQRIGMLGHSLGGWTAIHMLSEEPRIRAVLALAPARTGMLYADIMSVARPVMILVGDMDGYGLYDADAALFRAIPASAPDHWFGALHRANHFIELEICYALPSQTPCDRLAPQSETATSVEQAGIAFLQVFVAGDERFRPLLDPSAYGGGLTLVAARSGEAAPALPTAVR